MRCFRFILSLCSVALPLAACAQVTFGNVSITGSLSAGASWNAGPTFIEFLFPNARVGDGEAARSGNINILYTASTNRPIFADDILLSVLGALSGSGQIFFNEVIEDFTDPNNPVIIGSHQVVLTSNAQLPYTHHLVFDRPADLIRVKKELVLTANPDTQAFDFASIGIVQQSMSLVPEPGTLIAMGVGVSALAARRRGRKK